MCSCFFFSQNPFSKNQTIETGLKSKTNQNVEHYSNKQNWGTKDKNTVWHHIKRENLVTSPFHSLNFYLRSTIQNIYHKWHHY